MKKALYFLALGSFISLTSFSSAYAVSITYTSGLTSELSGANITTYDFDSTTPSTITGNYEIISGSDSTNAAPYGDTTNYLAVPKDVQQNPLSATITFDSLCDYLGLYWGSIDTYNSISFYNGSTWLYTLTGSGINVGTTAYGNQTSTDTNKYVNIYTDFDFDSIVLTSTSYAFELDNLTVRAVPEPASLLLFGTGLLGLTSIARRRKNN